MSGGKDLVATCTVCNQRNTFRQLPPTAINKDDTRLFCNTCNLVTLQKIVGGALGGSSTPSSTGYGGVGGGIGSNSNKRQVESGDQLWSRFERSVLDSGMRISDIYRCDEGTRRAVVERLGFRPEADRLLALIVERHPQNLIPAAVAPTVAASDVHASGGSTPMQVPLSQGAYGASNRVAAPYGTNNSSGAAGGGRALFQSSATRRNFDETSPLRGISYVNDAIIARCSVHPELPAEYWCCTCNVLVSSRCHVQGVHKDHPFITLRVAAEGHVRDLMAWGDRCRSQLGTTESIIANLSHSGTLVQQSRQSQMEALDRYTESMIEDLMRWKEQLKGDIHSAVDSQVNSIEYATKLAEEMHEIYAHQLRVSDPLMSTVPAADNNDKAAEEWSLRVLDFVSKLKLLNVEPIPLPKIFVPEVKCLATPASQMELLKQVAVPLGVRLPDLIDPGYFNFPQPTSSARVPFTLQPPPDAKSKGVLIYSGRTMTRAQDVLPSQTLVTASQVFYSGTTSWEVHIDRLGAGPGRILAGVIIHGSDGEGIVWDGQRIVGPNEGECRVVDEKYVLRPGSVLRFVLELDGPQQYLNCFFDRDGVARIPLPPTGNGWVPAFSVFGPQDQITVVPTSSVTRLATVSGKKDEGAASVNTQKVKEQEQMIASLQQQIQSLSMRLDAEQFRATVLEAGTSQLQTQQTQQRTPSRPPQPTAGVYGGLPSGNALPVGSAQRPSVQSITPPASGRGQAPAYGAGAYAQQQGGYSGGRTASGTSSSPPPQQHQQTPTAAAAAGGAAATGADSAYTPELQSLLRFVEEIR